MQLNEVEDTAYRWLQKHYGEVICQKPKIPTFVCKGGKGFLAKRVYGSKVWMYESQLRKLKRMENVYLIAIEEGKEEPTAIIPCSELECGMKISGLEIYCPKKNVEISTDLYREIKKLGNIDDLLRVIRSVVKEAENEYGSVTVKDERMFSAGVELDLIPVLKYVKSDLKSEKGEYNWSSFLSDLLTFYKRRKEPKVSGIQNELLSALGFLIMMRKGMGNELKLVNYLMGRKEAPFEELKSVVPNIEEVISNLEKYNIVWTYRKTDGKKYVKLLCWFKEEKTPNKVRYIVMYSPDFCRMCCSSFIDCSLYRKIKEGNKFAGRVFEFSIDEYEKSSVDELIGRCVSECIEEL